MMSNIKLRKATSDDLDVLLAFEQNVLEAERPFNPSIKPLDANYYDLKGMVNDDNTLLLVAVDDNQIIGSGYAQIRASKTSSLIHEVHSYLGFMYVTPEFRGLGINKMIIDKLIEWTKGKGIYDVYLDVYADNKAAVRAYEKVGFTKSLVEMKLNLNA
jgi:ribosomal protein S18 acetylase RimI-like enzyme